MKQFATAQTDESDNSLAGSTAGNLADYGEPTRLEQNNPFWLSKQYIINQLIFCGKGDL